MWLCDFVFISPGMPSALISTAFSSHNSHTEHRRGPQETKLSQARVRRLRLQKNKTGNRNKTTLKGDTSREKNSSRHCPKKHGGRERTLLDFLALTVFLVYFFTKLYMMHKLGVGRGRGNFGNARKHAQCTWMCSLRWMLHRCSLIHFDDSALAPSFDLRVSREKTAVLLDFVQITYPKIKRQRYKKTSNRIWKTSRSSPMN